MNTMTIENSLGISFCERLELAFTHGKGSKVWDTADKEYLDFTSGWGVTCLGHAHPVIVEAVTSQAQLIMQCPNAGFTYSPARASLLKTMHSILPEGLTNVYFCNSGAEANDAALKLARKITGRSKVISTTGSFHGRSFSTLSVSRGPENSARYLPKHIDTSFVPYGDIAALTKAMDHTIAALIVEPIQGEGGVQIPTQSWLAQAQSLCREHGVLLIVDEIQTGFCRTGAFFAHQHSAQAVKPDLMTMAKGIAGGFPFAAFAVSAEVNSKLSKDDHGGTYCGNPLGCAVSDAVVSYLRDHNIAQQVGIKGLALLQGLQLLLQEFPDLLRQARGLGLLCALELYDHSLVRPLTLLCAQHGLLVVPTRNGVIRLLPDLLVCVADIEQALLLLGKALTTLKSTVTAPMLQSSD